MEFFLDFSLIRNILVQEHQRASGEIRDLGVLRALERSQQRHGARIAAAPDVGTLACRAGCTWCCYFTVDVRAAEGFRIPDVVEARPRGWINLGRRERLRPIALSEFRTHIFDIGPSVALVSPDRALPEGIACGMDAPHQRRGRQRA
jgi:hypothetical protein